MKKLMLSAAAFAALSVAGPAVQAANGEQANSAVTVAEGRYVLSAGELIGQSVRDASGAEIATVDDILVTGNDRAVIAVLSVGGFLGIGDKLVTVPYDELKVRPDGLVLSRISESTLREMPEFLYGDERADRLARQRYMSRMNRAMDDWALRIDRTYEAAKDKTAKSATALSNEFSEAWLQTRRDFKKLQNATEETWEDAKAGFERSMTELRQGWDKENN
tara:strand:- start:71 stop:730 length:660 start_codon:yes stop_codon:yes gene_type:complete